MKHSPSACITLRPDADGNLVPVATARRRPDAGVRSGPFVIWDAVCQTTRAGDTLEACAQSFSWGRGACSHSTVPSAPNCAGSS